MDLCDAIDDAEEHDEATPLEQAEALIAGIESAATEMAADFKYPVDAHGRVMFVNHLHPDLMPGLVYHLVRRGWRRDPTKALIKPRQVVGSQFPDLVAWVSMNESDDPIHAPAPEKQQVWSVRPEVNMIDEKRQL